ncbi:MAG: DUF4113 domain-containing protein [Acidovorax sp.]|nr:DUF4113 domain-containing protein [Acidovorax sp.]
MGFPCGIGIGPTKTLAKLANFIAKTAERKPGSYPEQHAQVCNLGVLSDQELNALLAATEVGEVWGVGRKIGQAIIHAALMGLQAIYRSGYRYAKAGVMLMDLSPADRCQQELLLDTEENSADRSALMQVLDGMNRRYGRGTVQLGSAGLGGNERSWTMRQDRRTPGYTMDWEGLAVVRA